MVLADGERGRMHTQVRQALVSRNRFDVPRNQNDLTYIQSSGGYGNKFTMWMICQGSG